MPAWPFGVAGAAIGTAAIAVAWVGAKSCPSDTTLLDKVARVFLSPISPPKVSGDMMPVAPAMPTGKATIEPEAQPPVIETATPRPVEHLTPGSIRTAPARPASSAETTACTKGDPLCTPSSR